MVRNSQTKKGTCLQDAFFVWWDSQGSNFFAFMQKSSLRLPQSRSSKERKPLYFPYMEKFPLFPFFLLFPQQNFCFVGGPDKKGTAVSRARRFCRCRVARGRQKPRAQSIRCAARFIFDSYSIQVPSFRRPWGRLYFPLRPLPHFPPPLGGFSFKDTESTCLIYRFTL